MADKKVCEIQVNCCWECGRDNWSDNLYELKFKNNRTPVWLCKQCFDKLATKRAQEIMKEKEA
jgi:hypothetical protein